MVGFRWCGGYQLRMSDVSIPSWRSQKSQKGHVSLNHPLKRSLYELPGEIVSIYLRP